MYHFAAIGPKTERIEKKKYRQREIAAVIRHHGWDILTSSNFNATRDHIQHGNNTVNSHSKKVAAYSIALNDFLKLNCNKKDLVRGALLHDYFLYDWHIKGHEESEKLHGPNHPKIALRNAELEYELTDCQRDIIEKHMWPLTPRKVPKYKESWVVTLCDKYCSLLETLDRGSTDHHV